MRVIFSSSLTDTYILVNHVAEGSREVTHMMTTACHSHTHAIHSLYKNKTLKSNDFLFAGVTAYYEEMNGTLDVLVTPSAHNMGTAAVVPRISYQKNNA
jgi:hypothetical protein